ncbi:cytochrome c oxidase assembly protein [Nocardia sp. CDC159]|uniref:Cytochrome c oxidase assembly protein n=1 Tax=Nocardia pulmonis TaxID=2951408 RepID=A0A9X2IU49_9NOCA|nr:MULTISPECIES: cytochrome c oxidase assembly protein [Nocardia]MCM6772492.1 cytochrome c oxidase assembly protein [Nocardia pulmonis]MCM6784850.1 cytochrome c oxidase assembly protein [Nocardia sp. CDC159]
MPRRDATPLRPGHVERGWGAAVVALAAVLAAGLALAVTAQVGTQAYQQQGLEFPGYVHAASYVLLRLIAALAGGFTLGPLLFALFCTAPTAQGRVDVAGYAGVRLAERAAVIWLVAAVALIPVTAADSAGLSLAKALRLGALGPLLTAAEKPKAWLVASLAVLVVAVLLRLALSWNSLFGLTAVSAIAVLAPAVTGNAGEGPNHDYATGAVIPFALALAPLAGLSWCVAQNCRRTIDSTVALRRYRIIVALAVAVMLPTAAILVAILAPPSTFGGVYGWLGVAAAVLLGGHAVLVWVLGRRPARSGLGRTGSGTPDHPPTSAPRRTTAEAADEPNSRALVRNGPGARTHRRYALLVAASAAAVVWLGIATVMAVQPAPAFARRDFTAQQVFLGFDLPQPPSVWRFATVWRFDVVLGTAAILAAVAYLVGALRLWRRGDEWSRWRTVSWVAGCAALLVVTSSGIGAYGYGMFSAHMGGHMALNMFIPVLLVLGGPVTLLLRAVAPAGRGNPPGPREWAQSLMHSRFTRVLANPIVALIVFVISLYGLYFTALFDQLIRFHWGHLLMNIHFLITGYLYYWAIIGIDPGPRRLPHLGRLGMLFAIMPFHAFFGVAVMSMESLIGGTYYPQLQLGWMHDLLADQKIGGSLAWISGEVPVLLVVGALLSQWARQDRRVAARTDRHQDAYPDDDELTAYNAMLAELGRSRR